MRGFEVAHLADADLIKGLTAIAAQDWSTTAAYLMYLAEADTRKLYLPAGYSSMYAYCLGELHCSENLALKRIQAARTARQFPGILQAVADGRLHLSAVCLLSPHLAPDNVDELIEQATHQSKAEVQRMLAQRFGGADVLPIVTAFTPSAYSPGNTTANQTDVRDRGSEGIADPEASSAMPPPPPPGQAPAHPFAPSTHLASYRITLDQNKVQYAQSLLSHSLPGGHVSQVMDRALDLLIRHEEKRKFAATEKPRSKTPAAPMRPRTIPARVRRAVWKRDGGQCTFVGHTGHRCAARRFLEFDHIDPVARGGQATVEGMRLRCRGHNQYEAERAFGAGFMQQKREGAKRERAHRAQDQTQQDQTQRDLMAGLRSLGVRLFDAQRAIELTESLAGATLEERMREALKLLCPKVTQIAPASGSLIGQPA